jgi:YHS domain-containing protein
MTFIARMLRYLFWLLVVSWTFALLRRLVNHMGSAHTHPTRPMDVPNDAVAKKLVRDPVCGMHIAEGLALPLNQGSTILHFCSAECRDKFLNDTRKFAANA